MNLRRTLAARLYLASVLQLLLVLLLAMGFASPRSSPLFMVADREAHFLASQLEREPDPARREVLLAEARRALNATIEIRHTPPPPLPSTRLFNSDPTAAVVLRPCPHEGPRWLALSQPVPHSAWRFQTRFAVLTLCVGVLVSLALARTIVGPLEVLRRTTQRLGEGQLDARSRLDRRDELGELARSVDWMAERLEGLVRAQSELLGAVSHEVRTPLARMRVALDLSSEGLAPDVETLRDLSADVTDLERLVDEMLALARLDLARDASAQVKDAVRTHSFDPSEVARDVVDRARRRSPGRSVELLVEPPGVVARVRSSAPLLRRALGNLVDNALVHTPPGTHVVVALREEDDAVVLEVRDDGPGMEPSTREEALRPFSRSRDSELRVPDGLGLGLTVVRRISDALGGAFILRSSPGEGTTAELRLPLHSA